jgi:hypothetical protein
VFAGRLVCRRVDRLPDGLAGCINGLELGAKQFSGVGVDLFDL